MVAGGSHGSFRDSTRWLGDDQTGYQTNGRPMERQRLEISDSVWAGRALGGAIYIPGGHSSGECGIGYAVAIYGTLDGNFVGSVAGSNLAATSSLGGSKFDLGGYLVSGVLGSLE